MAKTMLVVFLSALLICTFFTQDVEATKYIGYGGMGRDTSPGCSPIHPELCKDIPANPYHRGCEAAARCRGGPSAEKEEEEAVSFPIPTPNLPRKMHQ
ncbi:hypothetical protein TSUD_104330 [Trifolium subterraneum]|uniref:Uncharacterized protein n=1 Tax=Trifolium subterraneum TaxID=3900 RepID=A0A2Z6M3N7_TRISU|nr:hypothetical protein TSUD_104330 [Trifolium subterraneum]